MRRISKDTLRKRLVEAGKLDATVKPFEDIEKEKLSFQTIAKARRFMEEKIIPLQIEGMKLVGCDARDDFLEYSKELLDVIEKNAHGEVRRFLLLEEGVAGELMPQMRAIYRRFARQRKCHNTANFMVCYCDERNKNKRASH
ncbi:MAG: hypothetical protein HYY92_03640 [Parcubacteria group bacterium]|nr:hypothetical protein [Parcubacteria group bacterium]